MGLEDRSVPAILSLLQGKSVDRSDYAADIPSGATGWQSWNRPLIALMCEALAAMAERDFKRVRWCLGIVREYLKIHPFMAGEQHSVIYWSWIAYPIWVCGCIAHALDDSELALACRNWLRAFVAYLAFGATRGPGCTLLDHNLKAMNKPRQLKATGPRLGSVPFVAWAGKRGWGRFDTDGNGTRDQFAHLDSPARGLALSQAAHLGLAAAKGTATWERDMTTAIQKRFDTSPWMLSESEALEVRRYLERPDLLDRALMVYYWLRSYGPKHRVIWRRYERGVACLLVEWGESSTAELGFAAGHDDGECIFASAATGLRQAGKNAGDEVDPGRGEWMLDHLAELRRDDGLYVVACEVPEKYGKRLYDLEAGGGFDAFFRLPNGHVVRELRDLHADEVPSVPPEAPTPVPPRKKRRCRLCEILKRMFR